MQVKNVAKKLVICGLSLAVIGGSTIGTAQANAKSIRYHQNRITKISTRESVSNTSRYKYLIKLNDEYDDNIGTKIVNNVQVPFIKNRIVQHLLRKKADRYLHRYIKDFSINQLKTLDSFDVSFSISNNSGKLLTKRLLELQCSHVKSLSIQDNTFDTELRKYLVDDINKTRIKYGRKPLVVTNIMQQVANYRANKVLYAYEHPQDLYNYEHITPAKVASEGGTTDNWIHGEDTHTSGGNYLDKHGYDPDNWSANAGAVYYNQSLSYNKTPYKYSSNSPRNIAYNMNDDYINNDDFYPARNGHRKNELNSNAKYLGVGVAYDQNTHLFVNDEQYYD